MFRDFKFYLETREVYQVVHFASRGQVFMSLRDLPAREPILDAAIDRHPLVVTPDCPLVDVVVLMSQTRGVTCSLSSAEPASNGFLSQEARSSCVLIMQGSQLLGIFTERDIVRLTAKGTGLDGVTIGEVMICPVITLAKTDFQDIFAALFLFRRYHIRHLVVMDERGQVEGVVSPESIRQVLQPTNLLKLRRVSEVMSTQVIHAEPTVPVICLAQQMAEHQVSCIVIVDQDAEGEGLPTLLPMGIVTERDIVQFQALGLDLLRTEAGTVMSTPLFLASPQDSLWTAHQEMQRRRVQRLVVSWNWGTQLGLVTQTSLLRVFDPIEMYGVIETLQQGRDPQDRVSTASTPVLEPLAPDLMPSVGQRFGRSPRSSQPSADLNYLLLTLDTRLRNLAAHPEMTSQLRQSSLDSAIDELQKIRTLLNSFPDHPQSASL